MLHEIIERGRGIALTVASSLMNEFLGKYYNRLGMLADALVFVSKAQMNLVLSRVPYVRNKSYVIYNPSPNIPLVEKNLGDPTFLYLGGDSYVKGFHIFLKASWRTLMKGHKVRFLLAGNFKERNKSIIEALNGRFKGAYRLLGRLEHEEVLKLHSISRALIFPSICEEPLPYAVIEAMLAGTIPIASRVGGVPEIVEGSFAERMLFEPNDVDGLVDRVESVLAMSEEQLVDVGISLRESVLKRFNPEVAKRKLAKVFLG